MKTTILTFRTIIEKDDDLYHGFVPGLPGCHTQGKTIEETRKYLREAITGYLISLKKRGETIPFEQSFEAVETFDTRELFVDKSSHKAYA